MRYGGTVPRFTQVEFLTWLAQSKTASAVKKRLAALVEASRHQTIIMFVGRQAFLHRGGYVSLLR